jgi:hypothetical protein
MNDTDTLDAVSRETDDEAPFGYKPNGQPYKRDPASYASRTRKGDGAQGPTRRKTPNRPASGPTQTKARAKAVFDALTIPVSGLAMAGKALGNKALVADAITLGHAVPAIATTVAEVADQDERIAAIVDKLVQTGPYAALVTALVPVALQIAANHNAAIARAGRPLGVRTVDEIIESAINTPEQPDAAQ